MIALKHPSSSSPVKKQSTQSHLICGAGAHLSQLPPTCALHSLHHTHKSTYMPCFHMLPSLFPSCAEVPASLPPFNLPPHPALCTWSHPHTTFLSPTMHSKASAQQFLNTLPSPLYIFILLDCSFSHPYLALFKITHNRKTILSDFCLHSSPTLSALSALSALSSALCRLLPHASPLLLFYNYRDLPSSLWSLSPPNFPLSLSTCSLLTSLLDSQPNPSLLGQQFLGKWSGWWNNGWTQALLEQASILTHELPPLPLSSHSWMFWEWNNDFSQKPHDPLYKPLFKESSASLPPFTLRCLNAQSCHLQSTAFQTITSHGFHANYSDHFCPLAGNTTFCPFRPCHRQQKHFTLSHALTYCPAFSH